MMHEFFDEIADKYNSQTAIISRDKGAVTYREMADDVLRMASYYESISNNRIAIVCANTYSCLIHIYGAIIAGKETMLLEPFFQEDNLFEMIDFAGIETVVIPPKEKTLIQFMAEKGKSVFPLEERTYSKLDVFEENGAFLLFTSGTNNKSKCVFIESEKVLRNAKSLSDFMRNDGGNCAYIPVPISHLYANLMILVHLSLGKKIAIGEAKRQRRELIEYEPDIYVGTPSLLSYYFEKGIETNSLKKVIVAGSKCSAQLEGLCKMKDIFLQNIYGLTEAGGAVALNSKNNSIDEMSILDIYKLKENDGVYYLSSECIMRGYLNNIEATRNALSDSRLILSDVFKENDNGTYCVTGRRNDFIVMTNGMKLSIDELENEIRDKIKQLDEVCVMYVNDRIVAVVRCNADSKDIEYYFDEINKNQPYYRKIQEVIVYKHAFPRTALGKLKRRDLETMYLEGRLNG